MLIAASLFDVLSTLFRPLAGSGGGYGSAIIGRVAWRMMRIVPRSRLPLGFAGPAIMVVVILVWIVTLMSSRTRRIPKARETCLAVTIGKAPG